MSEIEDLRAEVERLRANGLDWMKRYEAAVEHERAAEARQRKVEALHRHAGRPAGGHCEHDGDPWPCDTIAALAAEPAEAGA